MEGEEGEGEREHREKEKREEAETLRNAPPVPPDEKNARCLEVFRFYTISFRPLRSRVVRRHSLQCFKKKVRLSSLRLIMFDIESEGVGGGSFRGGGVVDFGAVIHVELVPES